MEPVKLSLVIPAWNEERRLPRTLESCIAFLRKQPYNSEIIIVTDGSTDRTVEVALAFKSKFPQLDVISFPDKLGKGFGVRTGMLAARGAYRVFMDADDAVPVETLDTFIKKVKEGYDIVIGSRAMDSSQIVHGQGFVRQKLAQLFGSLQWLILRLPFRDTQCGFKLFTASAAQTYFPLVTYNCAYFDAELLFVAYHAKARIAQLPVVWSHDDETRLPIGFKRSIDLFKKLVAIPKIHAKTAQRLQRQLNTPVGAANCER